MNPDRIQIQNPAAELVVSCNGYRIMLPSWLSHALRHESLLVPLPPLRMHALPPRQAPAHPRPGPCCAPSPWTLLRTLALDPAAHPRPGPCCAPSPWTLLRTLTLDPAAHPHPGPCCAPSPWTGFGLVVFFCHPLGTSPRPNPVPTWPCCCWPTQHACYCCPYSCWP